MGIVRDDGIIVAPDLGGPADRIVDDLAAHLAHVDADEFMAILPFEFGTDDYTEITGTVAERIAPALGWTPAG